MKRHLLVFVLGLLVWAGDAIPLQAAAPLVLVAEPGVCAPIVVAAEAPPSMRTAADELAEMIGRISGQTPEVIVGAPWPETAIWVGPALETVFPELDLSFEQPEEILIAATAQRMIAPYLHAS